MNQAVVDVFSIQSYIPTSFYVFIFIFIHRARHDTPIIVLTSSIEYMHACRHETRISVSYHTRPFTLNALAKPNRKDRKTSLPFASCGNPARQSHPRTAACAVVFVVVFFFFPFSRESEPRMDSIMSFPMSEKVLDPVIEETDLASTARGDGG